MRRLILMPIVFGLLTSACASEHINSKRTNQENTEPASNDSELENLEELDALGLTQSQCSIPDTVNKVTVSPRAQIYINASQVLNDNRAKNSLVGKWSFAYAMREILELPAPSNNPTLLAAEQAKIEEFVSVFIKTAKVNSFSPEVRGSTRSQILNVWGTTTGSDGNNYRTFDKAPFKLVAIANRLDIVKKGQTSVTAGEGRFIYGFTGAGQMTVILEYNLPIGTASNKGMTSATAWASRWQALKTFLVDTNTTIPGVQPNPSTNTQPNFANVAGYLTALEGLTELWANRTAQKFTTGTQAAISQIRTNEFLSSPWQLREVVRTRNTAGASVLTLTTVKNNPDQTLNNNATLKTWLTANVLCRVATDKNTCAFNTANGQIPATIPVGTKTQSVLGVQSNAPFSWFSGQADTKLRFFALQSCNGCHTNETGTGFTHVSTTNGAPSAFLLNDMVARVSNFKNLVCLGAANTSNLNLAPANEDDLNLLRINISNSTH